MQSGGSLVVQTRSFRDKGIQLSPILPEDDPFGFAVIEGARDARGEIADRPMPSAS